MSAKGIVRKLAAASPPCDSEYATCPLCSSLRAWDENGHKKKCPWRRARKWVAAHPLADEPMLRQNEHGLWETSETVRTQALANTSRRTVALEDEEPEPDPP